MPLAAPVTTATFPSSRIGFSRELNQKFGALPFATYQLLKQHFGLIDRAYLLDNSGWVDPLRSKQIDGLKVVIESVEDTMEG